MVLLEFSMSPMDKGESLSPYVGRIINIIDASGVSYKLNPMGTVLEGEWGEVMDVVSRCFHELEKDCRRISISIKIDYRAGRTNQIQKKIEKVEKILGKKLST